MPTKELRLKPIDSNNVLKSKVYDQLKAAITSMDIYAAETDTKLDERRLADELGVSRTPIREALMLLEKEGLIRMIPRRGAFVVRKTKREILEMICVWGALESLAARLATVNASDKEISGLRETFVNLDDANSALAAIDEYSEKNIRFHQSIIRLSKCELLQDIADGLFVHMRAIRSRSVKERRQLADSVVEHVHIIEALEKRDAVLAEKLVREHTDHLSTHVKKYVTWVE
ncbi:MAG: GntR family transcriptional regulator [gamma proteobacterium symbiont of Ctena orbiculata]|nr:MAG: GntR family transcriptional regulator [gamma proteobacterium symbiont of Ctena orbiculata]